MKYRELKENARQIAIDKQRTVKKDFFTWLETAQTDEKEKELAIKKHDARISIYRPFDMLENRAIEKERYVKRGMDGHALLSAMKFNLKNHRSGGVLYAERLIKSLTPNFNWCR